MTCTMTHAMCSILNCGILVLQEVLRSVSPKFSCLVGFPPAAILKSTLRVVIFPAWFVTKTSTPIHLQLVLKQRQAFRRQLQDIHPSLR